MPRPTCHHVRKGRTQTKNKPTRSRGNGCGGRSGAWKKATLMHTTAREHGGRKRQVSWTQILRRDRAESSDDYTTTTTTRTTSCTTNEETPSKRPRRHAKSRKRERRHNNKNLSSTRNHTFAVTWKRASCKIVCVNRRGRNRRNHTDKSLNPTESHHGFRPKTYNVPNRKLQIEIDVTNSIDNIKTERLPTTPAKSQIKPTLQNTRKTNTRLGWQCAMAFELDDHQWNGTCTLDKKNVVTKPGEPVFGTHWNTEIV